MPRDLPTVTRKAADAMSHEIEWTVVPVDGVVFVYADGRYVGEVGRSVLARGSRRWWASTGWETTRRRFPTRDAALDSLRASIRDGEGRS